jgi:hypothetical protein
LTWPHPSAHDYKGHTNSTVLEEKTLNPRY